MTIEKVLEYDAEAALLDINEVIDNPVLSDHLGYTEELKLKEAREILDKLVTELKKAG